ncbi:MAG: hypothetical protein OXE81_07240 [Gammaproteobacteria bacterium]|nr:hypothetical protein [Gammaproteobacteria bacterium]
MSRSAVRACRAFFVAASRRRWGEADREFCRDLTLWAYKVLWPPKTYKEADREEMLMNWMEEFPDVVEEIRKDIMALRFEQVSDWIVDCESEEELLSKLPNGRGAGC